MNVTEDKIHQGTRVYVDGVIRSDRNSIRVVTSSEISEKRLENVISSTLETNVCFPIVTFVSG